MISLREKKYLLPKGVPKGSSIRECQGRGRGLPEIDTLTLSDAMNDPEYKELIASLRNQCYSVLKILLPE